MAQTVGSVFEADYNIMNIDFVHANLKQEVQLLNLESHAKDRQIEILLNANALELALIKYLLQGTFLMFDRKKSLSISEFDQLIELSKLDTITYKTDLIKKYKEDHKTKDKIISELEISFLVGKTRVFLLWNFITIMADDRLFHLTQDLYLSSVEHNIIEVNKNMSFYARKILDGYYGIC